MPARYGRGFVLLRTDPTRDAEAFERAARERSMPLRSETLPEAAGVYGASLILVRPDCFVAWRGDGAPSDPGAVLDRVRGA